MKHEFYQWLLPPQDGRPARLSETRLTRAYVETYYPGGTPVADTLEVVDIPTYAELMLGYSNDGENENVGIMAVSYPLQ